MNITAIIQARMGSTRLPGKVLLDLAGKTVLEWVVERVRHAKSINEIVIATSTQPADDAIDKLCNKIGVRCYRGNEEDVLDRYYQAAKKYNAEHIARITSDCPLVDPKVVDATASEYEKRKCDYISTGRLTTTFPDGLDTEIFSFVSLERAWKEAKLPSEREHVTPYIWKHPELFRVEIYSHTEDLSHLRWTVDEPRDLEFVRRVYEALGKDGKMFYMNDILVLLAERPELSAINSDITRNAGYQKSLREERAKEEKI